MLALQSARLKKLFIDLLAKGDGADLDFLDYFVVGIEDRTIRDERALRRSCSRGIGADI